MPDANEMTPAEAFRFLKDIMIRDFDLRDEEILLSSGFEDLDLDSIDAVDLAVSIEDEIGVKFTAEDMSEIQTLEDVVNVLCRARLRRSG